MVEQGEKYVHHILTKPVDTLCMSYEPNVFEHVPSRWLRLVVPPVVESLSALSLSSTTKAIYDLTDKTKAQAIASTTTRKKGSKATANTQVAVDKDQQPKSKTYTEQANRAFNVQLTEKKILKLCKKPPNIKVTKICDIFPDPELREMEYATGVLAEGHAMPRDSFAVTSTTSAEACFYLPRPPPTHVQDECINGTIYATPQSILIVQKMTPQAPKKWLCLRESASTPNKLYAFELQDLRYKVTKDNSMDASTNAPVILQMKRPNASGSR